MASPGRSEEFNGLLTDVEGIPEVGCVHNDKFQAPSAHSTQGRSILKWLLLSISIAVNVVFFVLLLSPLRQTESSSALEVSQTFNAIAKNPTSASHSIAPTTRRSTTICGTKAMSIMAESRFLMNGLPSVASGRRRGFHGIRQKAYISSTVSQSALSQRLFISLGASIVADSHSHVRGITSATAWIHFAPKDEQYSRIPNIWPRILHS